MLTARMAKLVDEMTASVDSLAGDQERADAAARHLSDVLGERELLCDPDCASDPVRYCQHVLYVDPNSRFSIVSLVWLPGQTTPVHDHVCWCVVGVHQGTEIETRFEQIDDDGSHRLRETGVCTNSCGSVAALVPSGPNIHRVGAAVADQVTISIHIYGADIAARGTSIRTIYPDDMLIAAPGPAASA